MRLVLLVLIWVLLRCPLVLFLVPLLLKDVQQLSLLIQQL